MKPNYYNHEGGTRDLFNDYFDYMPLASVRSMFVSKAYEYVYRYKEKNGLEDLKKARYTLYRFKQYYNRERVYEDSTVTLPAYDQQTEWLVKNGLKDYLFMVNAAKKTKYEYGILCNIITLLDSLISYTELEQGTPSKGEN